MKKKYHSALPLVCPFTAILFIVSSLTHNKTCHTPSSASHSPSHTPTWVCGINHDKQPIYLYQMSRAYHEVIFTISLVLMICIHLLKSFISFVHHTKASGVWELLRFHTCFVKEISYETLQPWNTQQWLPTSTVWWWPVNLYYSTMLKLVVLLSEAYCELS